MPKYITFKEAYLAAKRLMNPSVATPSPWAIVKRIHDEALIDEFLIQLKMEGGTGKEEARHWVREMRGIYRAPQPATDMKTVTELAATIRKSGEVLANAQTEVERANDDQFAKMLWETMEEDWDRKDSHPPFGAIPTQKKEERYTVVGILPPPAVTKTPAQWCAELGKRIIDAGGWQGNMYRDFNEPITEAEFRWRLQQCTQALKDPVTTHPLY